MTKAWSEPGQGERSQYSKRRAGIRVLMWGSLLSWVSGCSGAQEEVMAPKPEAPVSPPEVTEKLTEDAAIDELGAQIDAGKIASALDFASQTLRANPDFDAFRINAGAWLWQVGKRREAVAFIDERPSSMKPHSEVARLSAVMHFELAKDGPNISYTRIQIVASPSKDPEADRRWVEEQFSLAESGGGLFLRLHEGDEHEERAVDLLVSIFVEQEKWDRALGVLDAHPKSVESSARLLELKGEAYLRTGASDRAVALARSGLRHKPRNLALLRILEGAARAEGALDEAERAAGLSAFYGFLVPGGELEYSKERATIVDELAGYFRRGGGSDDEEKERLAAVDARLAQLRASGDEVAAELLGAFVLHHSHDEREERATDALDAMGEVAHPVLLRMAEHAGSLCTIRSSFEVLSKDQVKEALPRMLELLPQDQRFGYPLYIPQALARMGSPEAVPELRKFLLSSPPQDLDSMSEIGLTFAREQAALALGVLGGPEAKLALLQAQNIAEMSKAALGGLCLHELKELEDEPAVEGGGPPPCQDFVRALSPDDMGTIDLGGQALVALEILGGAAVSEVVPELKRLKQEKGE